MKNLKAFISCASLLLLPAHGDYTFFSDDFESADLPGPNAEPPPFLGNGMVVGANVFDPSDSYIYNYFGYDAPNVTGEGSRFSNIAVDQGGPDQGDQVLAVFNDYNNNGAQEAGDLVDANVFVEFFLEEADLGSTVTFVFDAKLGNFQTGPVEGTNPPFDAEAEAFLKVLDPDNDYQPYDNIQTLDATMFPTTWGTYTLTIEIDEAWQGKLLQAGLRTKTSNYSPSEVFVDNFSLSSNRVELVESIARIVSTSKVGDEYFVSFESKAGYEYTLWKSLSLAGPYDDPADFADGDGSIQTLSDDIAREPGAFYRLEELKIAP